MPGQGLLVKQGLAQRVRIQASLSRQSPLSLHLRGGRGLTTVNGVLASDLVGQIISLAYYIFILFSFVVKQLDCCYIKPV